MAQNKSSGSTAKKTQNSTRSTKGSPTNSRPKAKHNRGINVLVFFILGVFTFLGYFNNEGIVIKFIRGLMSGLLGAGFYLLPPAFIVCAVIFAASKERPKGIRIFSVMILPTILGMFFQLFSKTSYEFSFDLFRLLWADGVSLSGGGAFAGFVELLLELLFSKAGALIFLLCITVAAVFCATGMTVQGVYQRIKKRYDENKEVKKQEEKADSQTREKSAGEPSAPASAAKNKRRASIDIPIDGEADTSSVGEEPISENKSKKSFLKKGSADELLKAAEENNKRGSQVKENKEGNTQEAQADDVISSAEVKKPSDEKTKAAGKTAEMAKEEREEREPTPEPIFPVIETVESEPEPATKSNVVPPQPLYVRPPKVVTQVGEDPHTSNNDENVEEKSFEQMLVSPVKTSGDISQYRFPPISLLAEPIESKADAQEELTATKDRLERALHSFGVDVQITNIINGPSVTRYELELQVGVKLNKITNLSEDIALALGVSGVRIAAVPNKISTVGIEVPNRNVSTVYLREVVTSSEFKNASSKLTFAIGKNIGGEVMLGNIAKLPHLLVAGTTGSGKSVCLNSLILSLMYKSTPDEVKFIMIDPKMVEFKIYNGIPHLLVPVVTEAKKAAGALQWAVTEMMKRYRLFSDVDAREIGGYNERMKASGQPTIPFIVVIIDELADLMLVAAKEVEESICRIAQMGRAAGVHLVIATQSPRADVITGLMKANIPSRIAFKVASGLESRIILDAGGAADKLMGNGDMLFAPIGSSKPERIQGTWVSDEERENIIKFVKSNGEASYAEDVIYEIEKAAENNEKSGSGKGGTAQEDNGKAYDELLPQAVDVIFDSNQASVSLLQRRLKLGYARAARIVDQMEELGVVGPFEGSKPRQILITRQQWQEKQFISGTAPIEHAPEAQAEMYEEVAPPADERQNEFLEDLFTENDD